MTDDTAQYVLHYLGNVIGNLNSRRGTINDTETRDEEFTALVDVSLNDMFGYSAALRGMTQGKGEFSMEYKVSRFPLRLAPNPLHLCPPALAAIGLHLTSASPVHNISSIASRRRHAYRPKDHGGRMAAGDCR